MPCPRALYIDWHNRLPVARATQVGDPVQLGRPKMCQVEEVVHPAMFTFTSFAALRPPGEVSVAGNVTMDRLYKLWLIGVKVYRCLRSLKTKTRLY